MPAPAVFHEDARGRVVVVDSVTHCDERTTGRDVVVAGSFAGALSLRLVLPFGLRGLVAHEAGVGKDAAGISALPLGDALGVPVVAVATMSARLGDGRSVLADGVVSHANAAARALGAAPGMPAAEAGRRLLDAPPGRPRPAAAVEAAGRVALTTPHGDVVLLASASLATAANARDVLCVGSHGGRVNARPLLAVRPRGVISNDGGMARDASGADGLPVLDEAGVAAATVAADSARIGEAESTWETGVISAVNARAAALGVAIGQPSREAALRLLRP